jgi:hypothetical protein
MLAVQASSPTVVCPGGKRDSFQHLDPYRRPLPPTIDVDVVVPDTNRLDTPPLFLLVLFFILFALDHVFKMFAAVLRRRALQSSLSFQFARCYASKSFPPHKVVTMPALSPTMTAGNIGTWQKKPGDAIHPGDILVEIETDKAQMDFEFQEEGVLAKILKPSGEKDVAVGNVSF